MTPLSSLMSFEGLMFILRYLHIFAGIVWIGLLYYFNMVQTPFFGETDAATKSGAIQKLVPRALWWFRWGAFWTATLGLLIIGARIGQLHEAYYMSSRGMNIMTGGLMGLVMACNVWFVIWPAQQVVIKSATDAAAGKPAIPEAAARGARAGVASRTNTLLSIPMLFFMAAAVHLPYTVTEHSNLMAYWIGVVVVVGLVEANALKGPLRFMSTVKGTVTGGFVLTAIFLGLLCAFM